MVVSPIFDLEDGSHHVTLIKQQKKAVTYQSLDIDEENIPILSSNIRVHKHFNKHNVDNSTTKQIQMQMNHQCYEDDEISHLSDPTFHYPQLSQDNPKIFNSGNNNPSRTNSCNTTNNNNNNNNNSKRILSPLLLRKPLRRLKRVWNNNNSAARQKTTTTGPSNPVVKPGHFPSLDIPSVAEEYSVIKPSTHFLLSGEVSNSQIIERRSPQRNTNRNIDGGGGGESNECDPLLIFRNASTDSSSHSHGYHYKGISSSSPNRPLDVAFNDEDQSPPIAPDSYLTWTIVGSLYILLVASASIPHMITLPQSYAIWMHIGFVCMAKVIVGYYICIQRSRIPHFSGWTSLWKPTRKIEIERTIPTKQ